MGLPIHVSPRWLLIMTPLEAILLANMQWQRECCMNSDERDVEICGLNGQEISSTKRTKIIDTEKYRYFHSPTGVFCEDLNITKSKEQELIGSLVRKGIVKRKMFGMPARRFIAIRHKHIEKLIKEYREKRNIKLTAREQIIEQYF